MTALPALPAFLVGSDRATTRRGVRRALVVFAATLLLLPATLAVSGSLAPYSSALADAVSTVVLVGLVAVPAALLVVHAYRRGGYLAALALGLAAPAAAVCVVVVANAAGLAESDLALAPTIGTLGALVILCSTALFVATFAGRTAVTRLR